jgi:hypothetical protein
MKVIKAPEPLPVQRQTLFSHDGTERIVPNSIFLAGSIEMGTAEDWQSKVEKHYEDEKGYIFNPRRDDWDAGWDQSIHNENFNEQVSWEMTALDISQTIIMNFCEDTKSPISLLELGLYAKSGKVVVCCPDGFWRKGNVEMVCDRYGLRLFNTMEELLKGIGRWNR